MLPAGIESEPVRQAIAFASLFILVFILGALVTFLVVQLVKKTGLSSADRVFGLGFGFLRGILIIIVFVVVGGLTPLPNEDWWQRSLLLERFENIAIWLQDYVPADMNMKFDRSLA
jgi:membrane protein required for colicin V production